MPATLVLQNRVRKTMSNETMMHNYTYQVNNVREWRRKQLKIRVKI